MPTLLTSRMLQRINENSCPLSPTTIPQINYFEENYLRSQRTARAVLCEGKCPQETSTFKFSVSRLPQWAKSKVTSPLVIPMDPILSEVAEREDHSPSKSLNGGNGPVNLVLHTPSNHKTQRFTQTSSSGTSKSKASTTQGTCRSFALDKRWLTIHTVCLDLLNSPEVYNIKEPSVPLSSDLSKSHALETTDIGSMNHGATKCSLNGTSYNNNHDVGQAACLNFHIGFNDSGCLTHNIGQRQFNEATDLQENFTHGSSELSTSVTNKCILNSTNSKTEAPKSSSRKSYSARFTVRRDLLRGQKLPLDLPMNDISETINGFKETSLTNLSLSDQQDSERGSCSKQDQQDCNTTTLDACKEALRSLAASSKTTLEVFSKLKDVNPEAEFYGDTAEMLESIAKNVHEIAKIATSCGNEKVDIHTGFEPLLGKFAESLTQRVIELLKENCTTLL